MVVKLIFILGYLALVHFLTDELILARKWKRLVKYPERFGFTDEEFDGEFSVKEFSFDDSF